MSNDSSKKRVDDDRQKVYVRSLDKVATVRRIENDSVWGKQYLVSTYSREWGPEYFWVKEDDVEEMNGVKNGRRD
jgi:hypothetical protein